MAACSVKSAKITADNKEQLLEDATWSRGITGEEVGLLASAFKESAYTGEKIEGKTVGEVLAGRKRLQAEEKKTQQAKLDAEEIRFKEVQKRDELGKYMTVTPAKKVFLDTGIYDGVFDSRMEMELIIDNKSDKDIKTFSGMVLFKDKTGSVLMTRSATYYGLTYGDIKAGEKRRWINIQRYNENDPGDRALKKASLENLTFEWETRRIIFSDGLSVGMEH